MATRSRSLKWHREEDRGESGARRGTRFELVFVSFCWCLIFRFWKICGCGWFVLVGVVGLSSRFGVLGWVLLTVGVVGGIAGGPLEGFSLGSLGGRAWAACRLPVVGGVGVWPCGVYARRVAGFERLMVYVYV
jgi:hypothetical protein